MSENLILIALTNKAKEIDPDIERGLDDLGEKIKFFYRKKSNVGEKERIALPYPQGNGSWNALLLKKNEGENYFLAVDVKKNVKNLHSKSFYLLEGGTRCQIYRKSIYRFYRDYALDHQKIVDEVRQLDIWYPYQGDDIEQDKWGAYLKLYKDIIDRKEIDFSINNIKIVNGKLTATIENADEKISDDDDVGDIRRKDKVMASRGESVHVKTGESSKKLGELLSVFRNQVKVTLDKDILKGLFPSENSDGIIIIEDKEYTAKFCTPDQMPKGVYHKAELLEFTYENIGYKAKKAVFTACDTKRADNLDQGNVCTDDVHENQCQDESAGIYIYHHSISLLNIKCHIDCSDDKKQIKVMKRSFKKVKEMPIWKVLSGERVSKLPANVEDLDLSSTKLNDEQKNAVTGAMGAQELFLIWGPPGTGKTEVIKEIARQESKRGNKTLITSQANLAVDNALSRLYGDNDCYTFRIPRKEYELEGEDLERVPTKNSAPKFYLDLLEKKVRDNTSDEHRLVQEQFIDAIKKSREVIQMDNKTDAQLAEFEQLAELYKKKINVVGATLMVSGGSKIKSQTGINCFDTVIIDEVSKATPPELFIPVPLGKKLILVGDHKQLPPMFKMLSEEEKTLEQWAKEIGISEDDLDVETTIFEHLWNWHKGDGASKCRAMLKKHYRMPPKLMALIEKFYEDGEGRLENSLSQEDISKLEIDHDFFRDTPAIWVGTKRDSLEKRDGTSFYNEDEIEKAGNMLEKLAKLNDKNLSVGVITFYGAQLRKLEGYERRYKDRFGEGKLTFGTVDRFQGRECDVIICSLVRNNKAGNIGFARKPNRINVAFSRARKALIILGSRELFAYEGREENALKIYKNIYDNCYKPTPKELGDE